MMSSPSPEKMATDKDVKFECAICLKDFSTSWCLQIHIKTHDEDKCLSCDECSQTFTDFISWCVHLKTHIYPEQEPNPETNPPVEEPPEVCNICGKSFPASEIVAHKRSHVFKPGLTCQVCEKSFGSSQVLKLHLRTHGQDTPYQCQICHVKFATRNAFSLHWNMHPDVDPLDQMNKKGKINSKKSVDIEKPTLNKKLMAPGRKNLFKSKNLVGKFVCTICSKVCTSSAALDDHIQKTHPKKPKKSCSNDQSAPKRLITNIEDPLIGIMKFRDKRYNCIICKKQFRGQVKARRHALYHSYQKIQTNTVAHPNQHSHQKRKRGRPYKNKALTYKDNQEPSVDSFTIAETFTSDQNSPENSNPKKKRGRPHKNQAPSLDSTTIADQNSPSKAEKFSNQHLTPKRKRGRPSLNKTTECHNNQAAVIDSTTIAETSISNQNSPDNPTPKRKRGRPFKNKAKVGPQTSSQENKLYPSEISGQELQLDTSKTITESYMCSECGKSCDDMKDLEDHRYVHIQEYASGLMRMLDKEGSKRLSFSPNKLDSVVNSASAEGPDSGHSKKKSNDDSTDDLSAHGILDLECINIDDGQHPAQALVNIKSAIDIVSDPTKLTSLTAKAHVFSYKDIMKCIVSKGNKMECKICGKQSDTIERISGHVKKHLKVGDSIIQKQAGSQQCDDKVKNARVVLKHLTPSDLKKYLRSEDNLKETTVPQNETMESTEVLFEDSDDYMDCFQGSFSDSDFDSNDNADDENPDEIVKPVTKPTSDTKKTSLSVEFDSDDNDGDPGHASAVASALAMCGEDLGNVSKDTKTRTDNNNKQPSPTDIEQKPDMVENATGFVEVLSPKNCVKLSKTSDDHLHDVTMLTENGMIRDTTQTNTEYVKQAKTDASDNRNESAKQIISMTTVDVEDNIDISFRSENNDSFGVIDIDVEVQEALSNNGENDSCDIAKEKDIQEHLSNPNKSTSEECPQLSSQEEDMDTSEGSSKGNVNKGQPNKCAEGRPNLSSSNLENTRDPSKEVEPNNNDDTKKSGETCSANKGLHGNKLQNISTGKFVANKRLLNNKSWDISSGTYPPIIEALLSQGGESQRYYHMLTSGFFNIAALCKTNQPKCIDTYDLRGQSGYYSPAEAAKHYVHKNGRYQCKICESLNADKHAMVKHIKRHMQTDRYHCSWCPYKGSFRPHVNRHMATHDKLKTQLHRLRKEMNIGQSDHSTVQQYASKSESLTVIQSPAHNEENVQDKELDASMVDLDLSMDVDTQEPVINNAEKPAQRNVSKVSESEGKAKCIDTFRAYATVLSPGKNPEQFFVSEEGEMKCVICGLVLAGKENMVKHVHRHAFLERYKCSLCFYRSSTKLNVYKHMARHGKILITEETENLMATEEENDKQLRMISTGMTDHANSNVDMDDVPFELPIIFDHFKTFQQNSVNMQASPARDITCQQNTPSSPKERDCQQVNSSSENDPKKIPCSFIVSRINLLIEEVEKETRGFGKDVLFKTGLINLNTVCETDEPECIELDVGQENVLSTQEACKLYKPTKTGKLRCLICNSTVSDKSNMVNHVKRHNKSERFACSWCGYKNHIRQHIVRHMGRHDRLKNVWLKLKNEIECLSIVIHHEDPPSKASLLIDLKEAMFVAFGRFDLGDKSTGNSSVKTSKTYIPSSDNVGNKIALTVSVSKLTGRCKGDQEAALRCKSAEKKKLKKQKTCDTDKSETEDNISRHSPDKLNRQMTDCSDQSKTVESLKSKCLEKPTMTSQNPASEEGLQNNDSPSCDGSKDEEHLNDAVDNVDGDEDHDDAMDDRETDESQNEQEISDDSDDCDQDWVPSVHDVSTRHGSSDEDNIQNDQPISPKSKRRKSQKPKRKYSSQAESGNHGQAEGRDFEDDLKCEICKRQMYCSLGLERHKLLHQALQEIGQDDESGEALRNIKLAKELTCPKCQKKYDTVKKFSDHLMYHYRENKFSCDVCGETFISSGTLKIHMNRHYNILPFACDKCPKRFVTKHTLKLHMRFHNQTDKVPCELCGKEITTVFMKQHMKRQHFGIVREQHFPCDRCGKMFHTKSEVQSHMNIVHNPKMFDIQDENHSNGDSDTVYNMDGYEDEDNNGADDHNENDNDMDKSCDEQEIIDESNDCDQDLVPSVHDVLMTHGSSDEGNIQNDQPISSKSKRKSTEPQKPNRKYHRQAESGNHGDDSQDDGNHGDCSRAQDGNHGVYSQTEGGNHGDRSQEDHGDRSQADHGNYGDRSETEGGDLADKLPRVFCVYKCEICKRLLRCSLGLERHKLLHQALNEIGQDDESGEALSNIKITKELTCPKCQKKYDTVKKFSDHLMYHYRENKFSCDVCGETFISSGTLKIHMNRHNNILPFACDKCPKRFVTKHNLKVHMRFHNQTHKIPCEYCGKEITTVFMKQHMKRQHSVIVEERHFPFGKMFFTKSEVQSHMNDVHNPKMCDSMDEDHVNGDAVDNVDEDRDDEYGAEDDDKDMDEFHNEQEISDDSNDCDRDLVTSVHDVLTTHGSSDEGNIHNDQPISHKPKRRKSTESRKPKRTYHRQAENGNHGDHRQEERNHGDHSQAESGNHGDHSQAESGNHGDHSQAEGGNHGDNSQEDHGNHGDHSHEDHGNHGDRSQAESGDLADKLPRVFCVYKCEMCKRHLRCRLGLERHKMIHQALNEIGQDDESGLPLSNIKLIKELTCPICQKKYDTIDKLGEHLMYHFKEKKFSCDLCGAAFKSSAALKTHKNRHNNIRPFACDKCPKRFVRKHCLKLHMRFHNQTHKVPCELCGKDITSVFMKLHMKRRHSVIAKDRQFSCDYCGKMFHTKSKVQSHMNNVHNQKKMYGIKAEDHINGTDAVDNVDEDHSGAAADHDEDMDESQDEQEISDNSDDCDQDWVPSVHDVSKRHGSSDEDNIHNDQLISPQSKRRKSSESQKPKRKFDWLQSPYECIDTFLGKSKVGLLEHDDNSLYFVEHGDKFKCTICESVVSKRKDILKHIRRHNEANRYKCKHCEFSSATKYHTLRHMESHFNSQGHLKAMPGVRVGGNHGDRIQGEDGNHGDRSRTHGGNHGDRNQAEDGDSTVDLPQVLCENQCEICKRQMYCSLGLERHKLLHQALQEIGQDDESGTALRQIKLAKELTCPKCEKKCETVKKFSDHLMYHFRENKFSCDVCGETFKTSGAFKAHMNRHNNIRPFACDKCPKSFFTKYSLKLHMRFHNQTDKVPCEVCGKRICSAFLKEHMKKRHSGKVREKQFPCDHCGRLFYSKYEVQNHVNNVHNPSKENAICDICGLILKNKYSLKYHRNIHSDERPFKCEVCGMAFRLQGTLKEHNKIHTGEKKYQCNMCDKSFRAPDTLRNHQNTHTGETPYQCNICDMRFKDRRACHKHKKSHLRPGIAMVTNT